MALPFLDSMVPGGFGTLARAATAKAKQHPVRLAWLFFPNGVVLEDWDLKGTGKNFELNTFCRREFALGGFVALLCMKTICHPGTHI